MIALLKQFSIILFALLNFTTSIGSPLGNATTSSPSVYDTDLAIIKSDLALNNYVSLYMSNLAVIESSYFVKNKKYLQRLEERGSLDLPFVKVHQYVAPNGEGYQAYFSISKNGYIFEKSIGVGVEAISRNYDWR